jgi:hypothetical protein
MGQDKLNQTALMRAVSREGIKLARLLIRRGSKMNAQRTNGDTALHLAIRRGGEGIFRQLLKAGANIFLRRYDAGRMEPRACYECESLNRHRFIGILDELARNALQPVHPRLQRTVRFIGNDVLKRWARGDRMRNRDLLFPFRRDTHFSTVVSTVASEICDKQRKAVKSRPPVKALKIRELRQNEKPCKTAQTDSFQFRVRCLQPLSHSSSAPLRAGGP